MGKPLFEHKTCGRCGGSGQYSYNLMHGSRCYGCNGGGYQLTKRGAAAQKFLNQLREVPATEIKLGDVVLFDGCGVSRSVFFTVDSIEPDTLNGHGRFNISGHVGAERFGIGCVEGTRIRKGFTADQKAAHKAEALAYQETLTAAGIPRKKAAKAA